MSKIIKPDFKQTAPKSELITRSRVIGIYRGLKSPALDVITNKSLMYAIQRSADKLESVVKLMEPEKVIPDYQQYLNDIRKLNEDLSGGKTIETERGEKVWDLNYNSLAYREAVEKINKQYGIDEYDEWINGEFEENLADFLHYANTKEIDMEKDIPNYGVFKLIHVLFKEKD